MKDVDREQIKIDFQENGIHGRAPEETEEMLDQYVDALRMANDFLEKEEGWRAPETHGRDHAGNEIRDQIVSEPV